MILPVSEYEGFTCDWPLGINNLDSLAGKDFDFETYKTVPQYFFIGSEDKGGDYRYSSIETNPVGGLFVTQTQTDFIFDTFGYWEPEVMESEANLMKNLGCDVTFKLYEGVGHEYEWNDDQMKKDVFAFLAQYIDTDNDGTPNSEDNCPNDPNKVEPGIDGCGSSDTDDGSTGSTSGSGGGGSGCFVNITKF